MVKNKLRFISLVLAIIVMFSSVQLKKAHAQDVLTTDVTCPFGSDITFNVEGVTVTSNSYRIPSMVTLADGTMVAAADIRWNTTYDGGGLDTIVAHSKNGGMTWDYTVANYLGDNGNEYNPQSTTFIDPSLVVAADGQTVYMLVDLYAYGIALNGNYMDGVAQFSKPSTEVGFNDYGYLKLSNDNNGSYGYYLKGDKIFKNDGTEVQDYTVDAYFNITGADGSVNTNLFFSDSPFKVARTGFLYMTKSTDCGKTWSEPTLLNLKTSSEQVCLVAPGRGITTLDGTMIFPVYSYNESASPTQSISFISSTDGVSWSRSDNFSGTSTFSSESAVIELDNGNLRFFYRNDNSVLSYADYNVISQKWGDEKKTTIATNSDTQLSAISYSNRVDGKQVILVSCPTGPNEAGSNDNNGACRVNGKIFVFTVEDDGSMTEIDTIAVTENIATSNLSGSDYTEEAGFFAYSCLTERADGFVAILYENNQYGWGYGDDKHYTMNYKVYDLGKRDIDFDAADVTVSGSGIPDNSRFVAREITGSEKVEEILIEAGADDLLSIDTDENGNVNKSFVLDVPYRFLDLSLIREGKEIQPDGSVTVTLDASSLGLSDGDEFMVYHLHPNEDGTYTNEWIGPFDAKEVEYGKISFSMDKFSYVLVMGTSYRIKDVNAFYVVQSYYDAKVFPLSTNTNWTLLGVYIDKNEVAHVLIGQLTNNINESKVNYISINNTPYYRKDGNIIVHNTGKITEIVQQKDGSPETVETIELTQTNLKDTKGVQAVWDVKAVDLEMTEIFELMLDSGAGGFDIGVTEVDLKLEYNISKDVVSVDGDKSLSGNSVVLPTTMDHNGSISCTYAGKDVIYRITARNTGEITLSNIVVFDKLPDGFFKDGTVYISMDGNTWKSVEVENGTFVVDQDVILSAGSSSTYYVKLTLMDSVTADTYVNTASMKVNNVVTDATAEITVQNPENAILVVSKTVKPAVPSILDTYFEFTLSDNDTTKTFKLRHGESTTFILPAGNYTVTENKHISGKFTAESCEISVELANGEIKTVDFINTYAGADYFTIEYIPVGPGTVTPGSENVTIDQGDTITYGTIMGSTATATPGCVFKGWYLDEQCSTLASYDANTGKFTPTMPDGGWRKDSVYRYYAKFEYDLTSLTIAKETVDEDGNVVNYDNIDPNQTFLFQVTGEGVDLTLSVHGNKSITITGLRVGETYTVTELSYWSWRYELDNWSFTTNGNTDMDMNGNTSEVTITLGAKENKILFKNERTRKYWLDGDSYVVNIFKEKVD